MKRTPGHLLPHNQDTVRVPMHKTLTDHWEEIGMVWWRVHVIIFCFLVIENQRNSQTEISSKCMYQHGATNICCHKDVYIEGLVAGVEHELKECNNEQLEWRGSSEDSPHCNENCCSSKVRPYQTEHRGRQGMGESRQVYIIFRSYVIPEFWPLNLTSFMKG